MRISNRKNLGLLSLLFLLFYGVINAQMVVSGTITDPDGFVVSDVVVEVVGNEDINTLSDFDGNYTLSIPENTTIDGNVTLRYSSIEFEETATFPYQEGNVTQDYAYTSNARALTEVVAIGYGKVDKRLATTAVDVVNSDEFQEGYITNADQLIQGKVAGLSVISDGSPQGGSQIRIRGGSSLRASNNPLIIVDGLPLATNEGISFLNPNDIESVSVLKDAAATSIYGNRGANGVIIYTTKKGSSSKWKTNYNAQFSLSDIPYDYNNLSSDELVNLVNNTDWETLGNQYNVQNPTDNLGIVNNGQRTYYDTNWLDEILGSGFSSTHNLTFSGKSFKTVPTRISGGYTANDGMLETSNYQRGVASISLNPTFFNKDLKVNLNANTSYEKIRYADLGQIGNAYLFDPTKPVHYDGLSFGNGFFEWADPSNPASHNTLAPANPVGALLQRHDTRTQNRYFGNLEFDYTLPFFRDLRVIVRGGLDQATWKGSDNIDQGARSGPTGGQGNLIGQLYSYNGFKENLSLDAYGVYTKEINNVDLEVTAGYAYQKFFARNDRTGNVLDPNNPEQVREFPRGEDALDKIKNNGDNYHTIGYFGRLTSTFLDKYLININYRYDGTSKFGDEHRWEHFPGVSVGWIMSKEDFLSGSSFVNELKLRASYGTTGNQSVPSYQFLPLYFDGITPSSYPFGDTVYAPLYPSFYNPNLRWEKMTDLTFGVDFKILDKKLSGSLDLFNRTTEDLLAEVPIAPGSNFANIGLTNKGDFDTKGVEFLLDWQAVNNSDVQLSFSYNIAYIEQEVTSLGNGDRVAVTGLDGVGVGQNIGYHVVGEAPFSFLVYEQTYDSNGKPLEGVFVDRNGDNVITTDDQYVHDKNPFPNYVMGLRADFSYKSFSFAMNWRAHLGNYIYNNLRSKNTYLSNIGANGTYALNISDDYFDNNFINSDESVAKSDYFIEDGSFLKLDNISLGYTFNDVMGDGTSIGVSLAGNNLLIITDSNAQDPEVYENGSYNNLYPRPRMYTLGINFNF